jgi:hypothetical protein
MKAPELRARFVDAVTSIMRAQNAGAAKKAYHTAMLAIHPDKQTNTTAKTLATSLSQKLSGLYQIRTSLPARVKTNLQNPTFVANLAKNRAAYDPSSSSPNISDMSSNNMFYNNNTDPNYTPSTPEYGARYRPQPTYNAGDRTRQRHPGDPVADTIYKHAHTTNPILFKRHVISKIPKEHRPCPPGAVPTHATCQKRIKPMVSMDAAKRQYTTFGDDLYWVGTEHGRRAIAHAIAKLVPSAALRKRLKTKAASLGFDVDGEMRRKRSDA